MREIFLIGNPVAGGGALKKIKEASEILANKGLDIKLMLTSQKGDAESFAKKIASDYPSLITHHPSLLVIAAGGDGTYNEVANGLAYSNIPMAILPLGTTSVLAKELQMPENIEAALDIALIGKAQEIHLGKIYTSHLTRYFLLMAGIGFDGETVFGVNEKIKKYSGKGAYILSGLNTLLKYNPEPVKLIYRHGDVASSLTGYVAIVGKASCYGGDFKITPDAKLTEPSFHVFLMHNKGRLDLIRCIICIVKGQRLKLKDTSYFKAEELLIEGSAHIQIDGDYADTAPARIEIARNALKLIAGV
ncbi:MAG: diacylglycerol kinase family lipid kinase [Thermodesulfovibrionales bacterium]|nr:diacylglycerol kinase family lipid kinase [Thermodesulfovibrionales bacterium]